MEMFIYFLISLALNVVAYAIMPKPSAPKPSVEDFKNPTASAGRPVPVVFGEVLCTGPNYLWYGAKMVNQRKADRPPAGFRSLPSGDVVEDSFYAQSN